MMNGFSFLGDELLHHFNLVCACVCACEYVSECVCICIHVTSRHFTVYLI